MLTDASSPLPLIPLLLLLLLCLLQLSAPLSALPPFITNANAQRVYNVKLGNTYIKSAESYIPAVSLSLSLFSSANEALVTVRTLFFVGNDVCTTRAGRKYCVAISKWRVRRVNRLRNRPVVCYHSITLNAL